VGGNGTGLRGNSASKGHLFPKRGSLEQLHSWRLGSKPIALSMIGSQRLYAPSSPLLLWMNCLLIPSTLIEIKFFQPISPAITHHIRRSIFPDSARRLL